MPDHSFREEIFPIIQAEPPQVQVEAISSSDTVCYPVWLDYTSYLMITSIKIPQDYQSTVQVLIYNHSKKKKLAAWTNQLWAVISQPTPDSFSPSGTALQV